MAFRFPEQVSLLFLLDYLRGLLKNNFKAIIKQNQRGKLKNLCLY